MGEPVVVDIISDDEADGFTSRKRLDAPYDSIKEGGDAINFVDLDQYLNSKANAGPFRPKLGAARDDWDDECMILDGDPDKPVATGGDDKRDKGDGSDDLCIVGQKGQVACRDYPHSRHLCANFPFIATSHVKHCNLCHCFVCDSPAPCIYWGNGVSLSDHCHATDKDETWKAQRKSFKKLNTTTLPLQKLPVSGHQSLSIQSPQQIFHRNQAHPTHTLAQPVRATAIHSCSTTSAATAYARLHPDSPALRYRRQRPHQQQSLLAPPRLAAPGKRANRVGLVLSPTSLPQFKRVVSAGSHLMSAGMTHPPHKAAPQRPQHPPLASLASQQWPVLPRNQSMPLSSQRSTFTPSTTQKSLDAAIASSEVDNSRKWQHILADVAAELGVSDSISQSLTSAQPYSVSSSSPALDVPIQCFMTPNLGPPTIPSDAIDIDTSWIHYVPEQNQRENSQLASQSFDPLVSGNTDSFSEDIHLESLLAAVEESAPMPGKEAGLPEVDPTSFLYDLDCSWSDVAIG